MKRISILCLVFFLSLASSAQIRYLTGVLEGSQEVPPTNSTGGGVVIVKYNMTSKTLQLMGNYSGLSDTITNSHIHLGQPGVPGPVIVPVNNTGGTAGSISVTAVITQAWEDSLLAGNTYANVHSKTFPTGELRAQLTVVSDGQIEFFNGRIQGAQEVPPNPSVATGSVAVLLDKSASKVFVTGSFQHLSAPASMAHVHRDPTGSSGPVIVPLNVTADTSGSVWGVATVSDAFIDSMLSGDTYVNIHDINYPAGEIRGQLTRLSQMHFLKAVLQGSQQVPPVASAGKGTVIVRYSSETKILGLLGDYQNVSSTVMMAHIHGPAPVGTNAPVLIPLNITGGTSGVINGGDTLTDAQEADLLSGNMYVNVHTGNFPNGEIRGQLTTTTDGQTEYLRGNLEGSQQVPSNGSDGSGRVTVLLDKLTNEVFLTGDFHYLSSPAAAGHIHRELAGSNGPVIVPLSVTADTAGTITGSAIVSSSFADSMIHGFTYVNIHDSIYPGGEIRAQLGDLVLPVKLKYFNGYKQNNKIALIWESAQEENLKQYEIEQQGQETGTWIRKAIVPAKGGSTAVKYAFLDDPLIFKSSYVMYRLKMVDISGQVSYSPVIRINFERSKTELTIASNPVLNNQLRYTITGLTTDKNAEVSVIDYNGRVVVKTITSALRTNTINVANLAAGMYRLIVRIDGELLQQNFAK